jgi:hypothetical protein
MYLQHIVDIDDQLQSPDLTSGQQIRFRALSAKMVHLMAEEVGELPQRVAVDVSAKEPAKHILIGVDVERAFPDSKPERIPDAEPEPTPPASAPTSPVPDAPDIAPEPEPLKTPAHDLHRGDASPSGGRGSVSW